LSRKESGEMTKSESDNIRVARGHLARALKHHKELAGHHDEIDERVAKLRAITATLGELGIESEPFTRALKELDHCGRAIRKSHGNAEDAADSAAGNVDRAADCVSAMRSK
jgi:hypothetical protein